ENAASDARLMMVDNGRSRLSASSFKRAISSEENRTETTASDRLTPSVPFCLPMATPLQPESCTCATACRRRPATTVSLDGVVFSHHYHTTHEGDRVVEVDAILCDYVQASDSKLFINGGGIMRSWVSPVPPHMITVGLGAIVQVPYTETNKPHTLRIALL